MRGEQASTILTFMPNMSKTARGSLGRSLVYTFILIFSKKSKKIYREKIQIFYFENGK